MDNETQKVVSEGQKYLDFIESPAWGLVKEQVITPALLDLQSVNNIKRSGPTDMAREVYARQIAVEYIMAIIRDIEGRAEQYKSNQGLVADALQII